MKEGSPFSGRNCKCVQCFMIIPKVSTADESPTQKLFQAAYRTAKAKKHHEPYRLEWNKWNNTHTHTHRAVFTLNFSTFVKNQFESWENMTMTAAI